jgi:hypothetical protein
MQPDAEYGPPVRDDGLQLEEHRTFQKRFWIAERCAWALFVSVLVLAVLGLTGSGGPFATRAASLATGHVRHPAVARWTATDEMTVTFAESAARHRLSLQGAFFDYFQIERVQPEPRAATAVEGGTVMEFASDRSQQAMVTLHLRVLRPGLARYSVGLDGTAIDVSTVILP